MSESLLPKCLIAVGGRTLLDYQLEFLARAGVDDVVMCVGFRARLIKEHLRRSEHRVKVSWVKNPDYLTTNNSYSLALALRDRPADFLVLNGDNLLDPRLIAFLASSSESVVPYVVKQRYDLEDMKLTYRQQGSAQYLTRIDKKIPLEEAGGEAIGARRFAGPVAQALVESLARLTATPEGRNRFFTAAVQEVVESGLPVAVHDVTSFEYAEIDCDDDRPHAEMAAARIQKRSGSENDRQERTGSI